MPIGKDSITKRVAKPAEATAKKEEKVAPELVATTAAAPKKAPRSHPPCRQGSRGVSFSGVSLSPQVRQA